MRLNGPAPCDFGPTTLTPRSPQVATRLVRWAHGAFAFAKGALRALVARRDSMTMAIWGTDRMVAKWRRRFRVEGLAGLDERPRPVRPRSFSPHADRRGQGAGVRASGADRPGAVALVGG